MRRCASGSQACESAPCCDTMRSGPKAAASSGTSRRTAASHGSAPVNGSSGTLTAVPAAVPSPDLVGIARAGEQVAAGLVQRQGQHARVGPVDRLDAVAVVDVEVEVQDAQAVVPRPGDRERRVVVDAEPGGAVRHRVMEAAAGVEGVLDVAAQDRLDRPQRPTGHRGTGVVHPGEGRIVAARGRCRPRPVRTDRPRSA